MLSSSLSLQTLLLATLSLTASAAPRSVPHTHQLSSVAAKAFSERTKIVQTADVIPFTRRPGNSKSAAYLNRLRKELNGAFNAEDAYDTEGEEPLQAVLTGSEYISEITFGEQTVSVVIDTGSSDTWLASSTFECLDAKGKSVPASTCSFGETYSGDLLTTTPDVNFNISYADGEFITGIFGTQDVTVGGITVPSQDVCQLIPSLALFLT
jgi:hypothetical protein